MADPQVGTALAEHPGDEGQVVVLDDHHRAPRRLRGQCFGERAVVRLVRRPLAPELRVEDRLQRGLVQHVVDEPQHGVRDAVVGVRVHVGVDVQHPYAVLGDPAPDRLAVAVAERRAHPQGPASGPIAERPETSPPPPRLARSEPSSWTS